MTIRLIDIVVDQFDAFLHTLIYKRNHTIFNNWEDLFLRFRDLSVNPISLRFAMYIF